MASYTQRKTVDRIVTGLCIVAALLAIIPLGSVLFYVAKQGAGALNWDFFTKLPKPVGETGGGMAHAIVGTLTILAIACILGVPIGILGGIYLAEFGGSPFAKVVRFSADVLTGVPSIVIGIFVYVLLVIPTKHFSALAGGVALSILMLPTVVRTTDELLRLVPDALREGALALGVPKWRATVSIVLRTAAPGIATGVMLAVARVAGETAPLLFTAFGNLGWSDGIGSPTASLPVQIFNYSVSPYADWHRQAWAAALVLVALVLFFNLAARLLVRDRSPAR
jgi:phosphate transport system permease protein